MDAIVNQGGSLLAIGISSFSGDFEKADVVEIIDSDKRVIARGISRFSHRELSKIKGKQNKEILSIFPGKKRPEVIHRDHLATLDLEKS